MSDDESQASTPPIVNINASVALKLARIAEAHYPGTSSGPIYGFFDQKQSTIDVTHLIAFPTQHTSGDDVFNVRPANAKFQSDYLLKLRESRIGAKLLGWFVTSTNGKHIRQTLIEAALALQERNTTESRDNLPALILLYDHSRALDGFVSLKVVKVSDAFRETWKSEAKFVAANIADKQLTYKNIFEEVPASVKNSHLTNLKIQEFAGADTYGNDLELTANYLRSTVQCVDQLTEAMDNFNHNLGNFNYFQRALSKEIPKINQWKLRAKQENEQRVKADPNAQVIEPDWKTQFKLPQVPSKYENLVMSGVVNSYCDNLETTGSVENSKTSSVKQSLGL